MINLLLHLTLLKDISPKVINSIIQRKQSNLAWNDLYHLSLHDWQFVFGLSEKNALAIHKGLADMSALDQEIEYMHKFDVKLVTILDDAYPILLKEIAVPPPLLYYRGTLPANDRTMLAVVGSRKMNFYGTNVIKKIVPDVVAHGVAIVSGGAIGVDRAAHECTVRNGGTTIAVLGSGLIEPYPQSNRTLFDEIVSSGGTVISSFSMHTKALPFHFPQRNRIIAGLSSGCLVVQAAQKSGALITARYALDQGREVCAIPGPIESTISAGCHALIQQGAALVTSADDILNVLSVPVQRQEDRVKSNGCQRQLDIALSPQEYAVYTSCNEPRTIDDIMQIVGCSLVQAQDLLARLQLEGYITQNFAGFWQQV